MLKYRNPNNLSAFSNAIQNLSSAHDYEAQNEDEGVDTLFEGSDDGNYSPSV